MTSKGTGSFADLVAAMAPSWLWCMDKDLSGLRPRLCAPLEILTAKTKEETGNDASEDVGKFELAAFVKAVSDPVVLFSR